MTVHAWVPTDFEPSAPPVCWKHNKSARGLLIDTPAIPLRFADELPPATDVSLCTAVPTDEPTPRRPDAALLRIHGRG